jgi:hypothetical protein
MGGWSEWWWFMQAIRVAWCSMSVYPSDPSRLVLEDPNALSDPPLA